MTKELVLHAQTAQALRNIETHPAHATLLVAPQGMGKGAIGIQLAAQLLGAKDITNVGGFVHVEPDEKQTISIEVIRELQKAVKLRTTGRQTIRRVILIESADAMTTEAQNALLKLLEEPPVDTVIILTSSNPQQLLPTIRSRVQILTILTPSKEQLEQHFNTHKGQKFTQAFFLGNSLPGLMTALLEDDSDHPLVRSVTEAKEVLQQTGFERLLHIESLSKQKQTAISFCEALQRIAEAGVKQSAEKNDAKRMKQWHAILQNSYEATENLGANANTKLVLTHLLLQLG